MYFSGLGVITNALNSLANLEPINVVAVLLINPFIATLIVGLVFESRLIPIIRGQSLSCFPGDLCLLGSTMIMIQQAGSVSPLDELPSFIIWWWEHGAIIALVFGLVLMFLMRTIYDAPAYRTIDGCSPDTATKLTHDFTGYVITPFVMGSIAPIAIWQGLCGAQSTIFDGMLSCLAVLMFLAWLSLDAIFDRRGIRHDPVKMHPDDSNCWYRILQRQLQKTTLEKIRKQS